MTDDATVIVLAEKDITSEKVKDICADPTAKENGWIYVLFDCKDPRACPCAECSEDHCSGVMLNGELKCKLQVSLERLVKI